MKTPVIASAAKQSRGTNEIPDCFVAYAPRNDGERLHDAGGEGVCDGSGGGCGTGRGGSRQAPALRPAIIQETTPATIPAPVMISRWRRTMPSKRRVAGSNGIRPR